jgi:hypothetical protein
MEKRKKRKYTKRKPGRKKAPKAIPIPTLLQLEAIVSIAQSIKAELNKLLK